MPHHRGIVRSQAQNGTFQGVRGNSSALAPAKRITVTAAKRITVTAAKRIAVPAAKRVAVASRTGGSRVHMQRGTVLSSPAAAATPAFESTAHSSAPVSVTESISIAIATALPAGSRVCQ